MSQYDTIHATFKQNLGGVDKLINFDRDVLELTVSQLRDLHSKLRKQGIDNPQLNGAATLKIISDIRTNDSLRPRYKTIFNQAVVLLVSYFASALGDLFREGVALRLNTDEKGALLEEEIKLTFSELRDRDWNLKEVAPDLLIAKKDLTFQDMGATNRAFQTYLGVSMQRDSFANDIILAQGCRHVIVHAGGIVTPRLVRQITSATPRHLKPDLRVGEAVQFEPEEVSAIAVNMGQYIEGLVEKLSAALPKSAG